SALVKLYAGEAGSAAMRSHSGAVVAAISRVEVPSAIWRKHRSSQLSAESAAALVAAFEREYAGFGQRPLIPVAMSSEILASAARVVAIHPLRAAYAIQLASALAARTADPGLAHFACFDTRLRAAAAAEGFRLVG